MVYADEILDYSGQRKTGVTAGSYGPASDVSPEAGGTITVPTLTVGQYGEITGAVNRTITLPNGGGGGGDEPFAKVYENTLTEDASQPIIIGPADLGGAYIDALVSVEFVEESALDGLRINFHPTPLTTIWIDTVPTGDYGVCVSLLSLGGLMFSTIQDTQNNGALKFEGRAYPDPDGPFQKITAIGVAALSGGGAGTIPSGTTITVYARKQVTE